MAMLLSPKLDNPIQIEKVLKMVVVHDLSEVMVGDMPAFAEGREAHQKVEEEAMKRLVSRYNNKVVSEIVALWHEFEEGTTPEAKFAKALDKLEVRIQHNESKLTTWNDEEFIRSQYAADKYCGYDSFLNAFNELVKKESLDKISQESDKDVDAILAEAEKARK